MAQSPAIAPVPTHRTSFVRTALAAAVGFLIALGITAVVVAALYFAGVIGHKESFKDVHISYGAGASGAVKTAGDLRMKATIDKIDDPAVNPNFFEPAGQGRHWLRYVVTLENIGQSESLGADFILRTTDGFEYKPQAASGLGAADLKSLQRITPGGKVTINVAFQVPDKTTIQWLRFDPDVFAGGDLYFDR
jgi:hypothetical protein